MIDSHSSGVLAQGAEAIDDCWNRIGVRGDKQCPLLARHIHCRNCEVYAAAATRLLDRYALMPEAQASTPAEVPSATGRSMLLLRLGEEWLALATASLAEIAPTQTVHALPHQRSRALQGVVNVRGALVPCLSLAQLLEIDLSAAPERATRSLPRMLILAAEGGPVVLPVDEIEGIHRLDPARLPAEPASTPYTLGVLHWRGRSVRVLDERQLLAAVKRSLS
ncbi:chemotaxis protein CheW [Pseudomonas cremoricolorata]|uniref:Chemotaxis protein CheW n=1 Tax=Pseudomonas cremoricolorata TaxID=157783 RepID=A0A089WF26_9PSED|nr:chemotaxis protein CheW [Pseudomonas cremoricolorata]AIR87900.1 chemotaxis protein CheW [Pseudomonas cremoricolorata]